MVVAQSEPFPRQSSNCQPSASLFQGLSGHQGFIRQRVISGAGGLDRRFVLQGDGAGGRQRANQRRGRVGLQLRNPRFSVCEALKGLSGDQALVRLQGVVSGAGGLDGFLVLQGDGVSGGQRLDGRVGVHCLFDGGQPVLHGLQGRQTQGVNQRGHLGGQRAVSGAGGLDGGLLGGVIGYGNILWLTQGGHCGVKGLGRLLVGLIGRVQFSQLGR